jgi:uncharacterized protein (DUF433 family)
MCARDRQPRSAARGVRLPSALVESIQHEARARGTSWSALATELLEEAMRLRQAPGIAFVDGATGRRAVVAGTGLDVWELVAAWKSLGEDFDELATAYPWLSEMQIRAALAYYGRFRDEIDERLEREERWTSERVAAELPYAAPRRAT